MRAAIKDKIKIPISLSFFHSVKQPFFSLLLNSTRTLSILSAGNLEELLDILNLLGLFFLKKKDVYAFSTFFSIIHPRSFIHPFSLSLSLSLSLSFYSFLPNTLPLRFDMFGKRRI
jgi:hypothetical protein